MATCSYQSIRHLTRASAVFPRLAITLPNAKFRGYAKETPDQGDVSSKVSDPSHNDVGPRKRHMTDKEPLDIQADSSHKAHAERESGSVNSQATARIDANESGQKAKEQHPKAPGPMIGMNDERGGKGI